MSPGPLVGLAVAVALRRWPRWALAVAVAGGWLSHIATGGQWSHRGLVAVLALPLALAPAGHTGTARVVAALAVGAAATVPDLAQSALGVGTILAAVLLPAGLLDRLPAQGRWPVAGVAALSGATLLAFTGSVRLAEECALVALPLFGLAGCTMPPTAVSTVALLAGSAVAMGVLRSELGLWAFVPLVVLMAGALARRGTGWAVLGAVGLAVLGVAPVLVDWFRDPPF